MGACNSAQRPEEPSSTQGPEFVPKDSRPDDGASPPLQAGAAAADAPAWAPATHAGDEPEPGPCSAAACKRAASADLGPLQTFEPARHTHDSASSHPGLSSRSGSLQQQQQLIRPAQRRRCTQPNLAPGPPATAGQSEDGGDSRRASMDSVRPVLIGDTPLGSLDLGAHLVSPLYPALQSAQSLQSASSMDPPKIASRLRSTPAGTMFERPKLGDRRSSVSIGALQRQNVRRSISGGFHRAAEPGIERILALCTSIFRTDAAAVTLRDGGRELRAGGERLISPGALSAACAALEPPSSGASVVGDPAADARLKDAPNAREEIKFFAAAPLVAANGYRLGSLCLAHSQPNDMDESRQLILRNMAELIVRELWGCYEHEHQQRILQLVRVVECYSEPHAFVEVSQATPWRLLHINHAALRVTGLEGADVSGKPFWEVFTGIEEGGQLKQAAVAAKAAAGEGFVLQAMHAASVGYGDAVPLALVFRPAAREVSTVAAEDGSAAEKPRPISNAGRHYYFVGVRVEGPTTQTSAGERTPFVGLTLGPMLGKGAYGRVYKGYYKGRVFAVKVCDRRRLRCNEAGVPIEEVITHLRHPHVVQTLDSAVALLRSPPGASPMLSPCGSGLQALGSNSGWSLPRTGTGYTSSGEDYLGNGEAKPLEESWLLMEYCDMGTLIEGVQQGRFRSVARGPPNYNVILATASEIAAGLAYLHSMAMVHGDLSSGNVLLTSAAGSAHGFSAKIGDLGLSRQMEIQSRIQTQTSGTVTYMAPEVLSDGFVSKAADLYSFGVLLWEMICGARAWESLSPPQVMIAVSCQGQRLEFPHKCPAELARLGGACMDPDPKKRPTFVEVRAQLEDLRARLAAHDTEAQEQRALSC